MKRFFKILVIVLAMSALLQTVVQAMNNGNDNKSKSVEGSSIRLKGDIGI